MKAQKDVESMYHHKCSSTSDCKKEMIAQDWRVSGDGLPVFTEVFAIPPFFEKYLLKYAI